MWSRLLGLLEAGSVLAFLAECRHRLFPAEMFADFFPSVGGRPSLPPEVVASVIVLQTLQGLSDREAAEAVTFDLWWKAACGVAVDAGGFHPSTLTWLCSMPISAAFSTCSGVPPITSASPAVAIAQ
jgi:hypothetical protein